jgi:NitT/TauT family transport system substrate-binding protein
MRFVLLLGSFLLFSHSSMAADKIKLALNWKPEPQFGGFYSADINGHFKQNGITAEILEGGMGTPVVQMIAAGKADFGIASGDEVVMSRANGGDVVALFAVYQTNPQGLMTHAERGFKSIADLFKSPGTLALQKGLPYAMYLMKKYPSPKVQLVPYLGGIQNFLSDKNFSQQCFVTSEPLAARKQGAKEKTFLIADEGYNPYTTVLITRGDTLKNKPRLVKSMVAAVRAGWRDYLDKPDGINKKMSELNKAMDLATFTESANAQKALIETAETKKSGLGTMTEDRWKQLSQQLLDLKVIRKAPPVGSIFTNQ